MNNSDSDFIENAYQTILGREPDQDGFLNYQKRLASGMSRSRMVLELVTSTEAKFRGFDASEIKDVISYYKNNKSRLPKFLLDFKIKTTYSDRINSFLYRMSSLGVQKDSYLLGKNETTSPTIEILKEDAISAKNEYERTKESAQKILDNINMERYRSHDVSYLSNVLGIHVPRWAGVTSATKNLFKYTFPAPLTADEFPEQMSKEKVLAIADVLGNSNFDTLVFSGGDYFQYEIAKKVKVISPNKSIRVIWHGSPRQLGPHYELNPFLAWIHAAESGLCDRFGTVKPGMENFLNSLKVPSGFIQNSIKTVLTELPNPCQESIVGLWLSHVSGYNKPSAPSMIALSGLKGIKLQGAGFGEDGVKLVTELGIKQKIIHKSTVPNKQVLDGMKSSRLTMYITLSECMPMIPFESISQGCPCLLGPSARVYDTLLLNDRLVVRDPFDSAEIRKKVNFALNNYDELRILSFDFLKRSQIRSEQSLKEFLN